MSDLVEKAQAAVMSEVFLLSQPDRGDVFSWLDDHSEVVARAAIKAVAEWLDEQHQIDRDGSAHCALSKQLKEGSE
jgi:hypothetical protein